MAEGLKNRLTLVLAILTVLFFFGTISSCTNAVRQKRSRDKEMATRLDLEEKMSKFTQEKQALETKNTALSQQLEETKTALEASKKALLQEQLVDQSLKDELQKLTKLKEALEEELKDNQDKSKSAKSKR